MDVFTVHEAMGSPDASRRGQGAQRGAHTGAGVVEPQVGVAGLMAGASSKQYMDPNVSLCPNRLLPPGKFLVFEFVVAHR